MIKIAIIGSRRMSGYGKEVIGRLMGELKGKAEVATIEVRGCNREVIRLGAEIVLKGDNFEKLNNELAQTAEKLVIVEGGKESGTILAAKAFLDLGKEIWAVPGRMTDENSVGTNWLIGQGANILGDIKELTT